MKTGMNSFISMIVGAGIEFCRFVKSHRNAAHPPDRFQPQFHQSSRVRGGSSHASGLHPFAAPEWEQRARISFSHDVLFKRWQQSERPLA
jgi:hypothetical protein